MTKDIIWAYANAVSQVCVEDDSVSGYNVDELLYSSVKSRPLAYVAQSCERVREKLEQFEPQNDMLTFVRGWGTGDVIPGISLFITLEWSGY